MSDSDDHTKKKIRRQRRRKNELSAATFSKLVFSVVFISWCLGFIIVCRDSNSDYILFIYNSVRIYISTIYYTHYIFALMMCSESKFMHTIPHNVGHVKRKRTSAKKKHILFMWISESKQTKEVKKKNEEIWKSTK